MDMIAVYILLASTVIYFLVLIKVVVSSQTAYAGYILGSVLPFHSTAHGNLISVALSFGRRLPVIGYGDVPQF